MILPWMVDTIIPPSIFGGIGEDRYVFGDGLGHGYGLMDGDGIGGG